jgi:hypothetical protein
MTELETGDAQVNVLAARERFNAALPHLEPARDSIEHAEDRMHGLNRDKQPTTLAPIKTS